MKKEVSYWKVGFFILLVGIVLYVVAVNGRDIRLSGVDEDIVFMNPPGEATHQLRYIGSLSYQKMKLL